MAETGETQVMTDGIEESVPRAGASMSTAAMLLLTAAILWGVSLLAHDQAPWARAGTPEHWLVFGGQVLRDIARAGAILAGAIAVSMFVPGIGLLLQRIIFGCPRGLFLGVAFAAAVLSSAAFSHFVLGHMAHIQDEIAMLFQAKILASGRLYAQTPALPEFFDYEFVLQDGPRWYGKYFFGPSLAMVPGVWLGVPWLVSPLLGGVAVLLTYALGRAVFNEKIARIAALLMVISPMRMSLFSMMMAHPSCLVAIALFTLAVARVIRDPSRWGWAGAAGLAAGYALNCRPLTTVVMGGVLALIVAARLPWRRLRWQTVVAFVVPAAVLVAAFVGYNRTLTGKWLLTPFTKWCPTDHLGFGPEVGLDYMPPDDLGHSWRKAILRNTYFNLDATGTNLAGWGHVTLLLLVWPILASPWPWKTRAAAAMIGALVVAYAFYYTPSVLGGQARYWSEAMPMMLLLVAVAVVNLRLILPRACRWLGIQRPARTAAGACWLAGLVMTLWFGKAAYGAIINECSDTYWGQGPMLHDLVVDAGKTSGLKEGIIFLRADHYRKYARKRKWDTYGSGFLLNDVDLKAPIVYARDLGDEMNAKLLAQYPGRQGYWVDLNDGTLARIVPLAEAKRPRQAK